MAPRSSCLKWSEARSGAFRWPTSRRRGWRFTGNEVCGVQRVARPPRTQREVSWMVSSSEILAAFREVSNTKQLDRAELYGLLQDGIMAALAKKYGANVQAEVNIDDGKGDIRIVLLKDVVDTVEDASRQVSVDDARSYDEGFQVGDVLEEPIDFAVFGRA